LLPDRRWQPSSTSSSELLVLTDLSSSSWPSSDATTFLFFCPDFIVFISAFGDGVGDLEREGDFERELDRERDDEREREDDGERELERERDDERERDCDGDLSCLLSFLPFTCRFSSLFDDKMECDVLGLGDMTFFGDMTLDDLSGSDSEGSGLTSSSFRLTLSLCFPVVPI
jgi:hypothetical protein